LSGGEFDLLMAFLEHPQRVLTREYVASLLGEAGFSVRTAPGVGEGGGAALADLLYLECSAIPAAVGASGERG